VNQAQKAISWLREINDFRSYSFGNFIDHLPQGLFCLTAGFAPRIAGGKQMKLVFVPSSSRLCLLEAV
jgi:hypothetical protein